MGTRNGFKYNHAKNRLDLYVGGTVVDTFDQPEGNTYYVNKATGSDSNDGLSWGSAFKEVNAAIIKSEADRLLLWDTPSTGVTTYDYTMRNRIIIQGVNADYTNISYTTNTVDPMFTDIYAISSWQRATSMGQVVIGHHDGTNRACYLYAPIGTNWYNIQWEGGTASYYSVLVANAISCAWIDGLIVAYTGGAGCFQTTGTFAGNLVEGYTFQNAGGSSTYFMTIGEDSGDNVVRECYFLAPGANTTTNAIKVAGGGHSSMIKDCVFQGVFTVGVADTTTYGVGLWNNVFGSGSVDAYTATQSRNYGGNTQANAHLAV